MRTATALLLVCCCLSAASGQWLETTIPLPDSFGSASPRAVYYVPNTHYVYAANGHGVVVVDAVTNTRVARMDMDEPMFMAYDSYDNKVYFCENGSLTVVDPGTHRVVSRLSVGRYPYRVCYNPTANKMYCLTGSRLDTLTVVDCGNDSVLVRIWVGWNEYPFSGICCNPAGNKVYVSSFETGSIAVVDGAGDTLLKSLSVGEFPVAPTYCSVSNKLYCAVFESSAVAVFDAGPDTLLRRMDVGWPLTLGYNPASNKVYCGDTDGRVYIIDCNSDTVLASLELNVGELMFFVFDSVDNRVFCLSDWYDPISVLSGSGDTLVGRVGLSGGSEDPDQACYDPLRNRLYVTNAVDGDNLYVVDAASYEVVTQIRMSGYPRLECYASAQDKLYVTDHDDGVIEVIDCATNSSRGRIFTPVDGLASPVYSSGSGKLFFDAPLGDSSQLLVVDCTKDSVEAVLPMNRDGAAASIYNPTMDRVYWAGRTPDSTVAVIDCAGDSIVARVPVGQNLISLACNPDSNRVYCASVRSDSLFISVIDCVADTVAGTVLAYAGYGSGSGRMCYVPGLDVVCSTTGDTCVVAVDGAAKRVLGYAPTGGNPNVLHPDPVSGKLYCTVPESSDIAVIDCRTMSLRAKIRVAYIAAELEFDSIADRVYVTSPTMGCVSVVDGRNDRFLGFVDVGNRPGPITWVPQHRRMYIVDPNGYAICVLKDTSVAGLAGASSFLSERAMPTVVRDVLFLPDAASLKPQAASLLDVSGRKVLDLKPGPNDVRALAPGVYFVREAQAQAVRKIVVTR